MHPKSNIPPLSQESRPWLPEPSCPMDDVPDHGLDVRRSLDGSGRFVPRQDQSRDLPLSEVNAPDVTVKGDGDDLVVARFKGDEVRLGLEVDRAEARNSKEPVLTLQRAMGR